jgi:hypothetical protein
MRFWSPAVARERRDLAAADLRLDRSRLSAAEFYVDVIILRACTLPPFFGFIECGDSEFRHAFGTENPGKDKRGCYRKRRGQQNRGEQSTVRSPTGRRYAVFNS